MSPVDQYGREERVVVVAVLVTQVESPARHMSIAQGPGPILPEIEELEIVVAVDVAQTLSSVPADSRVWWTVATETIVLLQQVARGVVELNHRWVE